MNQGDEEDASKLGLLSSEFSPLIVFLRYLSLIINK